MVPELTNLERFARIRFCGMSNVPDILFSLDCERALLLDRQFGLGAKGLDSPRHAGTFVNRRNGKMTWRAWLMREREEIDRFGQIKRFRPNSIIRV
ncbi:unnamed protein product [Protopolystoma xenopodis]|uniref:Uncharacterized protein n=1 Tax=Protopolystoma xenopodis TaxID=117903 RepID=A0A3S5BQK6_9PLAT|nr:unnamed protein product [Protopolystoma xenopodis]